MESIDQKSSEFSEYENSSKNSMNSGQLEYWLKETSLRTLKTLRNKTIKSIPTKSPISTAPFTERNNNNYENVIRDDDHDENNEKVNNKESEGLNHIISTNSRYECLEEKDNDQNVNDVDDDMKNKESLIEEDEVTFADDVDDVDNDEKPTNNNQKLSLKQSKEQNIETYRHHDSLLKHFFKFKEQQNHEESNKENIELFSNHLRIKETKEETKQIKGSQTSSQPLSEFSSFINNKNNNQNSHNQNNQNNNNFNHLKEFNSLLSNYSLKSSSKRNLQQQHQHYQPHLNKSSFIYAMEDLQKKAKALEEENIAMRQSITFYQNDRKSSMESSLVELSQTERKLSELQTKAKELDELRREYKRLKETSNEQSFKQKQLEKSLTIQRNNHEQTEQRLIKLSEENKTLTTELEKTNTLTKTLLTENKELSIKTDTLEKMKEKSTQSLLEKYTKSLQRIEELELQIGEWKNKAVVSKEEWKRLLNEENKKVKSLEALLNESKLETETQKLKVKNLEEQKCELNKKVAGILEENKGLEQKIVEKDEQVSNVEKKYVALIETVERMRIEREKEEYERQKEKVLERKQKEKEKEMLKNKKESHQPQEQTPISESHHIEDESTINVVYTTSGPFNNSNSNNSKNNSERSKVNSYAHHNMYKSNSEHPKPFNEDINNRNIVDVDVGVEENAENVYIKQEKEDEKHKEAGLVPFIDNHHQQCIEQQQQQHQQQQLHEQNKKNEKNEEDEHYEESEEKSEETEEKPLKSFQTTLIKEKNHKNSLNYYYIEEKQNISVKNSNSNSKNKSINAANTTSNTKNTTKFINIKNEILKNENNANSNKMKSNEKKKKSNEEKSRSHSSSSSKKMVIFSNSKNNKNNSNKKPLATTTKSTIITNTTTKINGENNKNTNTTNSTTNSNPNTIRKPSPIITGEEIQEQERYSISEPETNIIVPEISNSKTTTKRKTIDVSYLPEHYLYSDQINNSSSSGVNNNFFYNDDNETGVLTHPDYFEERDNGNGYHHHGHGHDCIYDNDHDQDHNHWNNQEKEQEFNNKEIINYASTNSTSTSIQLNKAMLYEYQQEALKLYQEQEELITQSEAMEDSLDTTVEQRAELSGRTRKVMEMIDWNTDKILAIKDKIKQEEEGRN